MNFLFGIFHRNSFWKLLVVGKFSLLRSNLLKGLSILFKSAWILTLSRRLLSVCEHMEEVSHHSEEFTLESFLIDYAFASFFFLCSFFANEKIIIFHIRDPNVDSHFLYLSWNENFPYIFDSHCCCVRELDGEVFHTMKLSVADTGWTWTILKSSFMNMKCWWRV